MAGDRVRITATVGSAGYRLPNVALTFTLPPELRAVGATGPTAACTVAPEHVTCPLGQLAAKAPIGASVELEAVRPGPHRFFPNSPPLARFDVAVTTGLRSNLPAQAGYVRVLAPGACANRNAITPLEAASFGGDRLIGGPNIDRVNALGGDDCVNGKGGDDVLGGGEGDDRLDGGPGKDILRGEAGNDVFVGGRGRDRLEGGPGRDRVAAVDRERDLVRCGPGRDRALVDKVDSVAGCESVKRIAPRKRRPR
jgi:hypothetical protein